MNATAKQLGLLDILAEKLGARDGLELLAEHCRISRSAAQRRATVGDASAAIDAAKEALETVERRAGITVDGEVDGNAVRLGGEWVSLSEASMALYVQHRDALDLARLAVRRAELKASGAATPFGTAVAEQLQPVELVGDAESIACACAFAAGQGVLC